MRKDTTSHHSSLRPSESPISSEMMIEASQSTRTPLKSDVHAGDVNLAAIEKEVLREDTQLWPNLDTQVQELAEQLQLVSSHDSHTISDVNLKAAMTSVVRIKASLAHDVHGASVAGGSSFITNTLPLKSSQHKSYEDKRSRSSTLESIPISPSTSVDELAGLVDKASRLEAELQNFHLPERHIAMLKDLNAKAEELKKTMENDMEKDRLEWAKEKSSLEQELRESQKQVDQLIDHHSRSLETLKKRYEQTLQETQGAMEEQTNAARAHINRLDDVIQQTHLQNNELKNRVQDLETQKLNQEQNRSTELVEAQRSIQSLTKASEEMKSLMQKTQLEHAEEIARINQSFAKNEHIQHAIIYDLEAKLKSEVTKWIV